MARRKQANKEAGGPYLAAALFCHSIVSDQEGHMTPANIFDTLNVVISPNAPANLPSEENRIQLPVWSFISFRTGYAPGDHDFHVVLESPSGKEEKKDERVITLKDEPQAAFNVNAKITFGAMVSDLGNNTLPSL